jgi:hypothetical protein
MMPNSLDTKGMSEAKVEKIKVSGMPRRRGVSMLNWPLGSCTQGLGMASGISSLFLV